MGMTHRQDSILENRYQNQQELIASRDYQVIKAAREGKAVDKLYPGHSKWYEEQMNILRELERQIKARDEEAARQVRKSKK